MHPQFGWALARSPRNASVALALIAALGCARHKEPEQASPQPSADPALAVCTALSAPGPLATRLAQQLPLSQGGLLLVLAGTDSAAVDRVFTSFGLSGTRVIGCGANDVVAWAPSVDANGAAALEAQLLKSAPAAKIGDRALLAPQLGEPPKRPRD